MSVGIESFELKKYTEEIFYAVNSLASAEEEGATKEAKFTEYALEILSDAGETEAARLCSFMKENKNENIEIKVDAYGLSENFETLDIFVSNYVDTTFPQEISMPVFHDLVRWIRNFANAALKGHLNDLETSSSAHGLANLIAGNSKKFARVNFFILSNGIYKKEETQKIKSIKGFEDLQLNLNIWDLSRFHKLSLSRNNREPIEINFDEIMVPGLNYLEMPVEIDNYDCYMLIVPGKALADLYKIYGTRLLESNVRAFLQQTGKVNKGIRDTILNEPHLFLPYNNGITATAKDVYFSEDENGNSKIIGWNDFQIVNGGQTTASLFYTEKKNKNADLSKVFVQMKLTVIKDEEKKDQLVPKISEYANTQNKVSLLDLSSNNSFLIQLEKLSRTTYVIDKDDRYKQSIWFFERVKGQYKEAENDLPKGPKRKAWKEKNPPKQKLIKSDISKYVNIFECVPYAVSRGGQKSYLYFLKEMESRFKKNKPNSNFWKDIVANAILYKTASELYGIKGRNPIGDTNIRSHVIAYSLSYLHHWTKGKINLERIWSEQSVPVELRNEIKKGLIYIFEYFKSLNVLLISEAAKRVDTWDGLKKNGINPFDMECLKLFIYEDKELQDKVMDDEVVDYEKLDKITKLGITYWDGLVKYNNKFNILSEYKSIVVARIYRCLKNNSSLKDKEIAQGFEIVQLVEKMGIKNDEITSLSKIKVDKNIDINAGIARIVLLSSSDWNRLLQTGEAMGKISFNESATIRTVQTKLKRKEKLMPKEVEIVIKCFDSLRSLGY